MPEELVELKDFIEKSMTIEVMTGVAVTLILKNIEYRILKDD